MTALRELAERWKAANRGETLYVAGKTAGMHACAAELLAILDAEGDGGAVGEAVAEVYECPRDHHEPVPTLLKGIRFTGVPLPVGTKLYTHSARSGVVSDEDVRDAERYRWLKKQHDGNEDGWHVRTSYSDVPDDLDKAIDAAIQGERHE